jgi:tRNA A-37 threonylcarbamoyl transferase component Bud32
MRLTPTWKPAPARPGAPRVRWRVAPAFRGRLPEGLPPTPDEGACLIKHGPHRTVWKLGLDGMAVYWKHCRLLGIRGWLRQCLRPPKARIEFDKALALTERGVPTVEPVAWGSRRLFWPSDSYLITRSLDHTEPLDRFLETTLSTLPPGRVAEVRRAVADELGKFLAKLHDAGVSHPDLHPGNLLIDLPPAGPPRFYLIDLHDARLGAPLDWPASRSNLVVLNRWFVLRADRADRLRFWRSYRAARQLGLGTPVGLDHPPARYQAAELEELSWRSNLRFWAGRDARCTNNNRHFRRLKTANAKGYAVRDLDADFLAKLLADPDAPFRDPDAKLLKDSRSSTVAELTVPTPTGPRRAVYKRFRVTTRFEPLKNLLRPSPALRSWRTGHGLLARYLPTPRPLAVFHRRKAGLSYEGYILVEKVESARDLYSHLDRVADRPAFLDVLGRVARLARDLHRRQLSHRDLKAANVLVGPDGGVWLIDLVGVRASAELGKPRRVQNLARLNASFLADPRVSRTDRLRFLLAYLDEGLHGRGGWKRWWRKVAKATQIKQARNARRDRPLA